MKKILIAVFVLFSFAAKSQTYQVMPQAGYGPVKRMLIDSILLLPIDTTGLRNLVGARNRAQVRYNSSDSSLYIYSGFQWIKVGSGGGGGSTDTTGLSYRIDQRVKYSDTATMLANYQTQIFQRVKISDTASMLTNYRHWLAGYTKNSDTSAMLANYRTWISGKVNISDTASMLTNYRHWLSGYIKSSDTAAMLSNYINAVDTNNIIRWKQSGNDIYNNNTGKVEIVGELFSRPSGSNDRFAIFNSGGAKFLRLDSAGRLVFNSSNASSPAPYIVVSHDGSIPTYGSVTPMVSIVPAASDQSGILIKGNSGQTGNLMSFRNSADDKLLTVDNLGSIAFGSDTADRNSLIDVRSTTKGILIPRMTAAQRAAISSPATGMLVYQTDGTEGVYQKLSSGWAVVSGGGSTPTLQQVLTAGSTLTGANAINGGGNSLDIYNTSGNNFYSIGRSAIGSAGASSRVAFAETNTDGVRLRTENIGNTNGSYLNIYKDSLMLQPQFGNLYIDSLNHSLTATDKMLVWDSVAKKVATRLIPSGGGGSGVTSVATNNATGITGGTITSTGTLALDTNLIVQTRADVQRKIDSAANANSTTFRGTTTDYRPFKYVGGSAFTFKGHRAGYGITYDSTSAGDTILIAKVDTATLFPAIRATDREDTSTLATRLYAQKAADSIVLSYSATAATASKLVMRDASANVYANGFFPNMTIAATAAGTTTLTVASNSEYQWTGTSTQTVVLPNATTLTVGWQTLHHNASTGAVTFQTNGGGSLWVLPAGQDASFICTSTGSSAGSWEIQMAGVDVQVFSSTGAGTWTKPSGAKVVTVTAFGAGGGGGGGNTGATATARIGGGGGGGGAYAFKTFVASDLGSTVAINVGLGGTAGGVGAAGTAGGNSTFGSTLVFAGGGGGGKGGTAATISVGGGGGGTATAGTTGTGTAAVAGGSPGASTATAVGGGGCQGAIAAAGAAEYGGGGGGGSSAVPAAGGVGGSSMYGGAAGAAGGGATTGNAFTAGGVGGNVGSYTAGGGGAAGATDGASGTNGAAGVTGQAGKGGGGGAGSAAGTGGLGGNGGYPAGGGGGGGGGITGRAGGAGANGIVVVITYF